MRENSELAEEYRRLARARGNIYYLFSNIYLSTPTERIVANVLKKDFLFGISHIIDDTHGVKLLRHFAEDFKPNRKSYRALAQDYRELFILPGVRYVGPYESIYSDKRHPDMGKRKSTIIGGSRPAVTRMYKLAGARIPKRLRNLPDHLGLELWFMFFMCHREAKAWARGNRRLAFRYLELQENFLRRHLLKWVDRVCDNVARLTRSDFYRGVAEITKRYVSQDHGEVEALVKEVRDL